MEESDESRPSPDDAKKQDTTLWMRPSQMQRLLAAGASSTQSSNEADDWIPPSVEDLQKILRQHEVSAFIARGGMGAVYKGTQKALKREVAIKILPPQMADRTELNFVGRFKQEAQTMAKLSHPNIVAVYDAGATSNGLFYFVMEYVEGTDLARLIASEGRLEPQRAVQITVAVCEALSFAHEEGIIHRDIKPSNIIIDRRGRIKVADFGLARALQPESTLFTDSHVAMGTLDFMAPEALSPSMKVDQRADIYAVGVMLYQMLTGAMPRGRFDLPSGMLPHLAREFDAVIDKALQADRERRYSTATELKTDVERACSARHDEPGTAPKRIELATQFSPGAVDGGSASEQKPSRKARPPVLLGLTALALAVASYAYLGKSQVSSPLRQSDSPAVSASSGTYWHPPAGKPGLVKSIKLGEVLSIALAPGDNRVLVGVGGRSDEHYAHVALVDLETDNAVWRTPLLHSESICVRSGANEAYAFGRSGSGTHEVGLHRIDIKTGQEISTWSVDHEIQGGNCRLSISPDGRLLCAAVQTGMDKRDPGAGYPATIWVFDSLTLKPVAEWNLKMQTTLATLAWLDARHFLASFSAGTSPLLSFNAELPAQPPAQYRTNLTQSIAVDFESQQLFGVGTDAPSLVSVPLTGSPMPIKLRALLPTRALVVSGSSLTALNSEKNELVAFDCKTHAQITDLSLPFRADQLVVSQDGSFCITRDNKSGTPNGFQISLYRLREVR